MEKYRWISLLVVMLLLLQAVSPFTVLAVDNNESRVLSGNIPPDEAQRKLVTKVLNRLIKEQDRAGEIWQTELTDEERQALLDFLSPRFYREGKRGRLVGFKFVVIPPRASAKGKYTGKPQPDLEWGWPHYFITGLACGPEIYRFATMVRGTGPGRLTLSYTRSVSNQWSASANVSAEVVSAGVGFDVTQSTTVQYSYSMDVPAGKTYEIDANDVFRRTYFQVYYNPAIGSAYWVGSGWADRFVGVAYSWWEVY